MIFHKKKETDKELLEEYNKRLLDDYTRVNTCCECEIYILVIQTYNYEYSMQPYLKKSCDIHKQDALKKYQDDIGSKLK